MRMKSELPPGVKPDSKLVQHYDRAVSLLARQSGITPP